MPHISIQAAFEASDQNSEDVMINTWHFDVSSNPPNATTLDAINSALFQFYAAIKPAFARNLLTGNYWTRMYNMADPPPRVPIRETLNTLTALNTGAAMPPEVCTVLSFEAVPISGVRASSRRGRVFLPTFTTDQFTTDGRLTTNVVAGISTAANNLMAASDAASDWTWVIYSRTRQLLGVVIRGWTDNAPDIQRRRGRDASIRDDWP